MSYALVANTFFKGAPNGGTTPPIDTTGANLIVLNTTPNDVGGPTTPFDSFGNTYILVRSENDLQAYSQLWYCFNPIVGPFHTFSSVSATTNFMGISAAAFSGSTPNPFNQATGQDGRAPNPPTSGSIQPGPLTPGANNCLVVVGFAGEIQTGTQVIDSGFTITNDYLQTPFLSLSGGLAYLIQTAATTVNPTLSVTGWVSGGLAITMATFFSAAAPPPPTTPNWSDFSIWAMRAAVHIPISIGIAPASANTSAAAFSVSISGTSPSFAIASAGVSVGALTVHNDLSPGLSIVSAGSSAQPVMATTSQPPVSLSGVSAGSTVAAISVQVTAVNLSLQAVSAGSAVSAFSTSSGTVVNFTLTESTGSSSNGFARLGMPFRKGDVPSGSVPTIMRGGLAIDAQFDQRTTWSDGSLKFAVCHLRDTSFSGHESRTYSIPIVVGSFNNTGIKNLSDITGSHDFKVTFASAVKFDGTSMTPYGSGAFTASLNAIAALGTASTRTKKVHSGIVCEGWEIWGMATDNATPTTPDAHLKTYWHVDIWKNSDGSIADIEYAPVVAQDWWSVSGKYRLTYDAVLKDGASAIQTYTAVQHPYRSQWIACRLQADNNMGRRNWVTAIPTLIYIFNQNYWIKTKQVPPLKLGVTVTANQYPAAYVPCSNENHRADISQAGGYMGRGIIANSDNVAFLRQDATAVKQARVNAHVGLHIPYHYKSNDVAPLTGDTANTAPSLIMGPSTQYPFGSYNFTADGMPTPTHSYSGYVTNGTPATFTNGYVWPLGGTGVWNMPNPENSAHAINYSYFMYLLEGERFHMETTLDIAANLNSGQLGTQFGALPFTGYTQAQYQGYPSQNDPHAEQWFAAGNCEVAGNPRAMGWALVIAGSAASIVPDGDVQANYFKTINKHMIAYHKDARKNALAGQLAAGWWIQYNCQGGSTPGSGGDCDFSRFMCNFINLGADWEYMLNEDTDAFQLATDTANVSIGIVNGGPYRIGEQNYALPRQSYSNPNLNAFDSVGNPWLPRDATLINRFRTSILASTNRITVYDCNGPAGSGGSVLTALITNGDILYPTTNSVTAPAIPIPSEIIADPNYAAAQPFYIVNWNFASLSFQLATDPTYPSAGRLITFTHDYPSSGSVGGAYFGWFPSKCNSYATAGSTGPNGVALPLIVADSDAAIDRAALVLANWCGVSAATSALVTKEQTFLSTIGSTALTWFSWNYDIPA